MSLLIVSQNALRPSPVPAEEEESMPLSPKAAAKVPAERLVTQ